MAAQQMLRGTPVRNEPKRNNRFILRFPSDIGVDEWTVKTSGRPSLKQNVVAMPYLNTSTYVLGRYEWDPIQVTLLDFIGPSTSQKLMEWLRLHSEFKTGRQGYAAGYMRDFELESLDPIGVDVEKWALVQCFASDVQFGDTNDHSNDEVQTVTFTLRPYYCEQLY